MLLMFATTLLQAYGAPMLQFRAGESTLVFAYCVIPTARGHLKPYKILTYL